MNAAVRLLPPLRRRRAAVMEGLLGTPRQVLGLAGLVAMVGALGWWMTGPPLRGSWANAGLLGVLMGWFVLCMVVRHRLQPTLAWLVPGYRATWRRVWLAGFVLLVLAQSVLLARLGAGWPGAVFAAALVLGLVAWITQMPLIYALTLPLLPGLLFAMPWGRGTPWWLAALGPDGLLPSGPGGLLLALAWAAAWTAWGAWRLDPMRRAWPGLRRSPRPVAQPWGRKGQGQGQGLGLPSFNWLGRLWMARLLRRARPTPNSVLARAELALLRDRHWTATVSTLAGLAGLVLLASLGWALWQWVQSEDRPFGLGVLRLSALPLLAFMFAASAGHLMIWLADAMANRRREQALLMLVPGMPRGAHLNRWLAARALWPWGVAWLAGVVLVGVLLGQGEVPGHLSLRQVRDALLSPWVPGMLLLQPVLLPLAWRNWASSRMGRGRMQLLFIVALGGSYLLGQEAAELALPWWPLVAASLLLAVPLMAWRWRQLSRWPAAWPARRLA